MSSDQRGWLEALLGKVFNSGVSIPLSKGLNFTSGIAASLNPTTKQIDVVASPTQATANALAPLLRGVGLTVDSDGRLRTRIRPRRPQLQDFFAGGNTTSGSIGQLGWGLFGTGTPAVSRISSSSLGLATVRLALSTSATTGNRSVLCLADGETSKITLASQVSLLQCVTDHANSLTDVRRFFGLSDDLGAEPASATNALGVYLDTAVSPNYQIIARAAGVGSPVDTGVPPTGVLDRQLLTMQRSSSTWGFYLGNTLIGTISSGLPTTTLNVGFRVEALSNAVATMRFGYFGLTGAIDDAYDDDEFLEE